MNRVTIALDADVELKPGNRVVLLKKAWSGAFTVCDLDHLKLHGVGTVAVVAENDQITVRRPTNAVRRPRAYSKAELALIPGT